MAVTDDIAPPAAEFERQPPQDVAAEQSVLGGMLLSKDAIADVVEVLRAGDFYRPAHQVIYETIIDLYGRGEPADPVTVSAELTRTGQLMRIGGAPYLHTLISSVPTAANAGYYAEIVAERAVLRRLIEAGTRIVQLGYGAANGQGGEVDDVVDRAQAAVYDVTEHRLSEDYVRLENLLQPTMDELDAIQSRDGASTGVPTGFAELDHITNGLHPGQMVIIAARPAIGKALALDTPLPTPTGWTTMGEVRIGDRLLGADGKPTTVVAATEVLTGRPCYEVEFAGGEVIVADARHQWPTNAGVLTTERLATTLGDRACEVALAAPLVLPEADLPAPPAEVGRAARRTGQIPAAYLRAGEQQRRDLLAGLLDEPAVPARGSMAVPARGSMAVPARGSMAVPARGSMAVPAGPLADQVLDLLHGLGYSATAHSAAGTATVRFARDPARRVVAVRPTGSVPVRCVEVDTDSHLYLAGPAMIPTHNSTLGLDFARACSIRHSMTSVIFSLEMSKSEITMRLLSAEAKVPLHHMRSGRMSDDDWARLARRMGEVADAPLYVDDSPNLTMMEIRAKARRLRQRQDLRLVIVDYLQLLTSGKRVENRQQEVSEFSRALKLLAKELDVPVVAIAQLNRGPEQRTDKRPMLSDLRESGCLTRDTALLRADTGAPVTLGELLERGHEGVLVWSVDEQRRLVAAPVTNVFASGVKETFRMRLAAGRAVEASGNHRFCTPGGWVALDDLTVGDLVAIPRRLPAPVGAGLDWSEQRLGRLARLVAAGRVPRLPDRLHAASDGELAVFLRHLWAAGGHLAEPPAGSGHGPVACYPSVSRELADGLAVLLSRLGIVAAVLPAGKAGQSAQAGQSGQGGGRGTWCVAVAGAAGMRGFRGRIGTPDRRGQYPAGLAGGAADPGVDADACGDVAWDRIVAVEPLGPRPVYDATVKGTHNFVAGGVVAHNSLEQDADMVLLLYREDAFEKESPRAGEADLILAKHRNGPTSTVTVAFQGHYSRFVDMQQG